MEETRDSILGALQDGYYEVDLEGNLTYFNQALADIFGRSREELGGLAFRAYTDPAYWDEVLEVFGEVYRTGQSRGVFYYELYRPDGSRRRAHYSVHLMHDGRGRPVGFRGIVRDVTEEHVRHRISETLRAISELLAGTLELNEVLKRCCDAVVEQSVGDRASIYLYEHDGDSFRPEMSRGVNDPELWAEFSEQSRATPENSPAFARVMASGEPVVIEDAQNTELLRRFSVKTFGLKSAVIYPLVARGEFVGVLVVDAFRQVVRFPATEIDLMQQISRQLASAIHQAQLFDAVREEADRFRMITTAMQDLIMVLTPDGRVEYASPSFGSTTGHRPEALVGTDIEVLVNPNDKAQVCDWFQAQTRTPAQSRGAVELRLRCADGRELWLEATANVVTGADNTVSSIVTSGRVITERKQLEAKLHQLAFYDAVTELPNRALLLNRLEHALERSKRTEGQVALCFIDLDRFKNINDTLGHSTGDRVLRAVALRLGEYVRPSDTLARFGGDEFVLLIEEVTDRDAARKITQRLQKALSEPLKVGAEQIHMPASIGLAFSEPDAARSDTLLREADTAMYEAKQAGGGQTVESGMP